MKNHSYILRSALCLLCAAMLLSCGSKWRQSNDEKALRGIRYEYGIPVDSFRVVTGTVQTGETLGGILNRLGAKRSTVNQLATINKDVFDVRQIQQGKQYMAFYQADTLLEYFVYEQSRTRAVVFHMKDSLHVEKQQKEIRVVHKTASATIQSSLWSAFTSQGVNPQLALELSEIYQWTVDFFGLQRGDKFDVVFDEEFVDDESIGIGTIYAARCQHGGATIYAYNFEHGNDCHGYFDENGKSLRKTFLKAPLNFKRISSTFTYARKHPIYKTVRPHTGVDYAAPMGTPVVALGDGTVTEKGYKGGGGNTIKIRHNATYTTAYLHLSKYGKGIEVGKHVQQGQVIGYVGSTGASTGPHLDFRVWKNGTPINPLTMESPSADPVPTRFKAEYDSIVTAYNKELPK